MGSSRKKAAGPLDWLLLAAAVAMAAFVIYHAAERWRERGSPVVAAPAPVPAPSSPNAAQPLAAAKDPESSEVSESFQAVSSIPPIVISRTGRPTVKTKAPPAPKVTPD